MVRVSAERFPRLVGVGLCYIALTALEIIFFQNWMTFARQVGVCLQTGFAAALIYGGLVRAREHGGRYGLPPGH
jgi:hypothetical protein